VTTRLNLLRCDSCDLFWQEYIEEDTPIICPNCSHDDTWIVIAQDLPEPSWAKDDPLKAAHWQDAYWPWDGDREAFYGERAARIW
jgi:hypothetical protein